MTIFFALTLLLSQPLTPGLAYTTDDPVNPERLGLATQDGRYMIEIIGNWCSWSVVANQNVVIQGYVSQQPPQDSSITSDGLGVYSLAQEDIPDIGCLVYVHQQMSTVACFTNSDQQCDIAQEFDTPS